jgi:hypothetical protein
MPSDSFLTKQLFPHQATLSSQSNFHSSDFRRVEPARPDRSEGSATRDSSPSPWQATTRNRSIGGLELAWQLLRVEVHGSIVGTWVPLQSSLKTKAFQCLDSEGGHPRCLSFSVQLVLCPLLHDPNTQLGIFAVLLRYIAVPVNFAKVGKLA